MRTSSDWRTKTNGTGVSLSLVFDTKAAMNTYIADNVNKLKPGQQFLIKDSTSCEYWWNGSAAVPLRGEMSSDIDLDDYVTKDGVELLKNKTIEAPTIRERVSHLTFVEKELPEIDTDSRFPISTCCYGEGVGFVALTNDGRGLFSPDGDNWELFTLPEEASNAAWANFCFTNHRFMASSDQHIITSTDGKNWTHYNYPSPISSGAYPQMAAAFGKFYFLRWYASKLGYTTDGTDWNYISIPSLKWLFLCGGKSKDGTERLLAVVNGANYAYYSVDGLTLIKTDLPWSDYWNQAKTNGITYIIHKANVNYFYSDDSLTNWNSAKLPATPNSNAYWTIYDDKFLYQASATANKMYSSSDGVHWDTIDLPKDWKVKCVCAGNDKVISFSSSDNTYLIADTRQDTTLTPSTLATKADIAAIDLSPYATTSDVSATYATKSNPQLSGGTIDGSSATNVWLNETCRLTTSKLLSSDGSTLTFPSSSGTIATMADIEEHTPDLSTYVTLDGRETLTNKTLTSPIINSVIVSNDNNIALPSAAGTLATLAGRETLTNKTLTSPIINEIVTTDNVTLALPSAAGTLATQSWVNTQIGNIGIDIQLYNLTGRASTTISSSWNWFYLLKLTSKIYVLSFSCTVSTRNHISIDPSIDINN